MCCLSDCKPNLPFVINLFCASYNLALLDNGISLKVVDIQQEESTSTNCPNSLRPPASFLCHTAWFYWQLSPSTSASFWCVSAVSCLAYAALWLYESISCIAQREMLSWYLPDSSALLCPLAFQFIPVWSSNSGALLFLCRATCKTGRDSFCGLMVGDGIQEPFSFGLLSQVDAWCLAQCRNQSVL